MNTFLEINHTVLKKAGTVVEFCFITKIVLKIKLRSLKKNQYCIMWVKLLRDLFTFGQYVFLCNIPLSSSIALNTGIIDLFEQIELVYRNINI